MKQMLDIVFITVGKLRNKDYLSAAEEYLKRLKQDARIKIIEVDPEPFSDSTREKAMKLEGERLMRALEKLEGTTVFFLDENGTEYSSIEFSDKLSAISGKIVFIVAGALGYSDEVRAIPGTRLSLSKMTFPHELARVMLYEQVYRAVAIMNKKTYHY